MSNHSSCLNCGLPASETDSYCSRCGQALDTHRFTFSHILHEFFHAFTHTDKTVFGLIAGLAVRPGKVVGEYLDGKRKKYFNPFTFLLLVAAFSILVIGWTGTIRHSANPSASLNQSSARANMDEKSRVMMERAKKVGEFMSKRQNLVMLIAVPFIALVYFLAYRKSGRNYAEHLVVNIFLNAFVILFSSILFYPLLAMFRQPPSMYVILLLMLASHCVYYTVAYGQLFQVKGWKGWLRMLLVSVLAILLWSMLTRFLIAWYIKGF